MIYNSLNLKEVLDMKGATIADATSINTEVLYEQILELQIQNQNLQTELMLLKTLIGE